jgi:hypothetical protein
MRGEIFIMAKTGEFRGIQAQGAFLLSLSLSVTESMLLKRSTMIMLELISKGK